MNIKDFKIGIRVKHPRYGKGTVVNNNTDLTIILVQFDKSSSYLHDASAHAFEFQGVLPNIEYHRNKMWFFFGYSIGELKIERTVHPDYLYDLIKDR